MNSRRSVFSHTLQAMINEGDFIVTKRMKLIHIESIYDKGLKVCLSGCLYLTEGFSTYDNYNNDYSSYPNFLATRILCSNEETKEVVKSNKAVCCKVSDVKDFAYVFHIDSLEKNDHVITGKENAFFTRFQLVTGRGKRSKVMSFEDFHPFNDYNDCRERIWNSLSQLENSVRQVMWSSNKNARATIKMNFSIDGWTLIRRKLKETCLYYEKKVMRRSIVRACDLSLIPRRKEHHLELLRVNTVNQMKKCMKLLGLTFMIGLKKRYCEKTGNKRCRTHMSLGDNGKHVAPLLNDDDVSADEDVRLNRFGQRPGIDLTYNVTKNELIIRVQYNHFTVKDSMQPHSIESMVFASDSNMNERIEDRNRNEDEGQFEDNNLIGLMFYSTVDKAHFKILSIQTADMITVVECDFLSGNALGDPIEYSKAIAKSSLDEEYC